MDYERGDCAVEKSWEEDAGWTEPGGELFEFAEETFAGGGGRCYHESDGQVSYAHI